ncbi:MAG: phosphotriesterase, partial [Agrococcus sp.]
AGAHLEVARRGAFVAVDHVGLDDDEHVGDAERVALVAELIDAGHLDRILLSSSATGVAKGHAGNAVPFSRVLTELVPALRAHDVDDDAIRRILTHNPSELLAVRS